MRLETGHERNDLLEAARLSRLSPSGSGRVMSRRELADAVNKYLYSRYGERGTLDETYIGRLERGDIRWPRERCREAMRKVLDAADDASLGFFVVRGTRPQSSTPGRPTANRERPLGRQLDDPADMEPLVGVLTELVDVTGPDEAAVSLIALAIDDIVERYERRGPALLVPEATKLKNLIGSNLACASSRDTRTELLGLQGRAAGVLAYMAVNLGRFRHAEAYSRHAFALAQVVGDRDLMAWVRGTQSFSAYYRQRYDEAAAFAEDGLRYAGEGPQAIRLQINGLARALAHLPGRAGEAEIAVGLAYRLAERHAVPDGISSCISLDIYSHGRLAANAVTVYQTLRQPRKALDLIHEVDDVVQASDSNWSRALVRLDHAAALLQSPRPEVEQSVALAVSAVDAATAAPITSVLQRGQRVLKEAQAIDAGAAEDLYVKIQSLRQATASPSR